MQEAIYKLKKQLNSNDIIVVACSGGPDSMCLTNVLLNLKNLFNLKIIVAHVNHNVRKASIIEKEFVERYCEENDIIFEYLKIKQYNDKNFHADARNIRYEFFINIVNKYQAKYLMTAHHANDLCETILMRLVRGSSLHGYTGINYQSNYRGVTVIRPLLGITKVEIIKYNQNHNVLYVCDESNDSDKYTRNRYRHHIVPLLEKENPNIYKNILDFTCKINEACDFINKYVDKKINNIYIEKEINIELLKKEELIVQKEIFRRILDIVYGDNIYLIEDKHIDEILFLLNSDSSNKEISLPNNIFAKKRYNKLLIKTNNINTEYKYVLNDIVETNKWIIKKIKETDEKSNDVLRIFSKDIKMPLVIRNKKEGDKIEVKNLQGNKKVKDIFIDEKVNKDIRNNYPVVTDSDNNILWIPGIKKSKFDKEKDEKYDIILKHKRKEEENEK